MFGLITVSSQLLQHMKVIQPQNSNLKLVMTQALGENNINVALLFHSVDVKVLCGEAN